MKCRLSVLKTVWSFLMSPTVLYKHLTSILHNTDHQLQFSSEKLLHVVDMNIVYQE